MNPAPQLVASPGGPESKGASLVDVSVPLVASVPLASPVLPASCDCAESTVPSELPPSSVDEPLPLLEEHAVDRSTIGPHAKRVQLAMVAVYVRGTRMAPTDLMQPAAWDAVETAARIRKKEVSATEVVGAAFARAEEARPLGAIVELTYERARANAGAPRSEAALAGVPTFVKDLAQMRGVPTGWGSAASSAYVSRRTDPFVKHFEETGVVTLGKSACPELGLTATTEPLGRPPCRNPWDPSRSSGGSSGGAATLVAAGVVPMAHGSDGGGSIRIPAACCGLVGLKPSRFRLATPWPSTRRSNPVVLRGGSRRSGRSPRSPPGRCAWASSSTRPPVPT